MLWSIKVDRSYGSIRFYWGLSGSIRVYQGLSGSIRVYQGLLWFIMFHRGLSGSIGVEILRHWKKIGLQYYYESSTKPICSYLVNVLCCIIYKSLEKKFHSCHFFKQTIVIVPGVSAKLSVDFLLRHSAYLLKIISKLLIKNKNTSFFEDADNFS